MTPERVSGGSVRVGDVLCVWWQPGESTVTKITPYTGPLAHLWPAGARIFRFVGGIEMTVGNDDTEERIVTGAAKASEKRCHRRTCPATWKCRACGAMCCEHRCSLKKNDGTATCGRCQREAPAT